MEEGNTKIGTHGDHPIGEGGKVHITESEVDDEYDFLGEDKSEFYMEAGGSSAQKIWNNHIVKDMKVN